MALRVETYVIQLDGGELANASRPREEGSRCATPGKGFQGLDITLHEGFFLGAGPAFELGFATPRRDKILEFFEVGYANRWIDQGLTSTFAATMRNETTVNIVAATNVDRPRSKAKDVNIASQELLYQIHPGSPRIIYYYWLAADFAKG